MIHRIHTPTEQFGFVETEFDTASITPEYGVQGIVNIHNEAVQAAKAQEGLDSKTFNGILDHYLSGKPFVGDEIMVQIEKMNVEQHAIMSAIKRSKARTK